MTHNEFELGYTPKNLKIIVNKLTETGMNQHQLAEKIGAGSYTTLGNWMAESDQPRHRNMPQEKWKNILELFNSIS